MEEQNTPFVVHLRKMYIHLSQQLKLYGKYTFISTSMNFIHTPHFFFLIQLINELLRNFLDLRLRSDHNLHFPFQKKKNCNNLRQLVRLNNNS